MKGFVYLASPYSGDEELNYSEAERAAAYFIYLGYSIFSPIVHCHEMCRRHQLPTSHDFWLSYDHRFLDVATELWILCIPGWSKSIGIADEVKYASQKGLEIPIRYIIPTGEGGYKLSWQPPQNVI